MTGADRLARRLQCHQALHDPALHPGNRSPWLPRLQAWQSARLERSFAAFLDDPRKAPAARFFLTDVYGDHDFSQRDADIARVLPMMRRLLPAMLLDAVADAIELGSLTHALDLRMAEALAAAVGRRRTVDEALYAAAYRQVGHPRLRARQIALIGQVGKSMGRALRMPGIGSLLRLARRPARAAGLESLQDFLERGYEAFHALGDVDGFIDEIQRSERALMERLFAGDAQPFRPV